MRPNRDACVTSSTLAERDGRGYGAPVEVPESDLVTNSKVLDLGGRAPAASTLGRSVPVNCRASTPATELTGPLIDRIGPKTAVAEPATAGARLVDAAPVTAFRTGVQVPASAQVGGEGNPGTQELSLTYVAGQPMSMAVGSRPEMAEMWAFQSFQAGCQGHGTRSPRLVANHSVACSPAGGHWPHGCSSTSEWPLPAQRVAMATRAAVDEAASLSMNTFSQPAANAVALSEVPCRPRPCWGLPGWPPWTAG
jgi:hypothetical protein